MKNLIKSLQFQLNLIAVAALAAAVALGSRPWVALLLALAVFGLIAWRSSDTLTANRIARTLTGLAVLIAVWNADGLDRWPLLAAGGLLTLFAAYVDLVFKALNVGYLQTANLDVERSLRERWSTPPKVSVLMSVLGVAFPAAALAGAFAADLVFAALTAGAFAWTAAGAVEGYLHRKRDAHPVDGRVMTAVTRLQPKFVVHFAGARESEYQLAMWLPYFERTGEPYMVLVRDRYLYEGVVARTSAPVVLVPAQGVLDTILPESVRACYYVNHAIKNAQLVKLDQYLHVQLMHGDSDKAISRSPVSLMYDRVFVAGQAGVDRYHRHGVDIPNYKFRRIGRPQLHDLRVGERERIGDARPVVLYTPTWTGLTADVNYSSLRVGKKIVEAVLARDVTLLFRTHPYTRTNAAYQALAEEVKALIAADAAATGRPHLWGAQAEDEVTLTECVNAADVAISDISGTASDWLYSGRPFAMTDPKGFGDKYLEEFPLAKAAYLIERDAGNIEKVLDELLVTDAKAVLRGEVREYYLGDHAPHELVPLFVAEVRATCGDAVRAPATGASALTAV
ncbi:CDP-Glycerol:Poly(glycerophosphate) glycerophosphotransferase [Glycomyces sambucus]|uniref:CDP-Glycerol:Poly(Glycerophosphate) glycerophosphotransferase n=1 Tax=Glycomyces sambucus TaxID=380244 RepID=A0A1G9GQS7_9ACTN|nr:CDP-glycerol glycerophosphotransferase family protein [Glycomyces sambucus]SDL02865.1 CDP-Glycerol:Poly(glycerophosphate) glycerophosphotransferase [Glycomyces sambucus]